MFVAGDALALHNACGSEHLDSVTECEYPLLLRIELFNDVEQPLVMTKILGGATANQQHGFVVGYVYTSEVDVRVKAIAGAFDVGVPSGFEIVHYKMEAAYGGRGDYRVPTCFAKAM